MTKALRNSQFLTHFSFLLAILTLLGGILPNDSHAFAVPVDLLGEAAKPLIGEAKDKAKGMLKYIWLQPYGGYAFGSGDYTFVGGSAGQSGGLAAEGIFYGGRGGFVLLNNMRFAGDFSRQIVTIGERQTKLKPKATTFGVLFGFDFPYTPIQVIGGRYFSARLQSYGTGDGWGGGIAFTLVNPFILIAEYRVITYGTDIDSTGERQFRKLAQYYLALSFMLL